MFLSHCSRKFFVFIIFSFTSTSTNGNNIFVFCLFFRIDDDDAVATCSEMDKLVGLVELIHFIGIANFIVDIVHLVFIRLCLFVCLRGNDNRNGLRDGLRDGFRDGDGDNFRLAHDNVLDLHQRRHRRVVREGDWTGEEQDQGMVRSGT